MTFLTWLFNRFFDPFWQLFYSIPSNKSRFEYSCLPLPLKINCVGCFGCSHNQKPFLSPPKPKGPYKVYVAESFCMQYENLFGQSALVELLYDLEKHNELIEERLKPNELC